MEYFSIVLKYLLLCLYFFIINLSLKEDVTFSITANRNLILKVISNWTQNETGIIILPSISYLVSNIISFEIVSIICTLLICIYIS